MIDFEPSDEQALIIETVRQFAENEIRPLARSADETGKLPTAVLAQAHELGLVANALPEEFGGGGERAAVLGALIAEELAWGDLSIAIGILSPALCAFPLIDHGNNALQRKFVPRFAAEPFFPGALALVEPRVGADPFRPALEARRLGASYVLEGAKCLVPWQDGGEIFVAVAALEGNPTAFVVPRDAPGLHVTPERHLGLQALPTAELQFERVEVSRDARIGEDRFDLANVITRSRVGIAAMGVGVARAAYEIAREYAKEREAFGGPIATKQAIAFKLADMAIEIDGARLLVWEAAWRLDQSESALREATLAYQQVCRVALEVADGAVQVLGGHGYTREYLPEMHLRNARGLTTFEGLALL